MAGSSRSSWRILLPTIVLVATACGGTTPVTSGPPAASTSAATPVPASQAGDGAPAPPSGALTGDPIAFDTSGDFRIPAAAQENAVRAAGRTKAAMADALGPDAATVATALDQAGSDQLWAIVDDATAVVVSRGPTAILASVRLPRSEPRVASIPPPGMSYLGPWIASVMLVDSRLGAGSAYSKSSHDESAVQLGPSKGTVTTDSTVSVTPSGSRVVVDVATKTKGEVSDADGRLIFRIDGNGHAHIEVQACPDAGGVSNASMEFSASELYFVSGDGGRIGNSWQDDDKADVQIFANDQAELDHDSVSMTTDHTSKGGTKAPGAGQTDLRDVAISTKSPGATLGPDGVFTMGESTFEGHGTTMAEIADASKGSRNVVGLAVHVTGKAAEKFWRSGKCIEVAVDPNGGDVGAGSTMTVTAKVRHKFENTELDKPVQATMTGVKSIEPSGTKVPSPATFKYSAGPSPQDAGIVTFKSVSNRGIGETTATFTVGGKELEVTVDGSSTTSALGASYRTTVKVTKLRLARQPDGSYLGSAPATTSIQLLGDIPCPAAFKEKGTVMLRATRGAAEDPATPPKWLITLAPGSKFTTSGDCYGIPLEQVAQSGPNGFTGDFIDLLGVMTIDGDGGTLKIKKTVPVGVSKTVFDVTVKGVAVTPPK